MSIGVIVILIITGYFALAAAAAPRLMRLVYRDNLAVRAERMQEHDEKMDEWRARKDRSALYMPLWHGDSELGAMLEARRFGFWLALAWPISLSYYQFGDTAFKQEIAAQHSKRNTKIIADYDKLLAERFDNELATPVKSGPLRIQRFFKEKP